MKKTAKQLAEELGVSATTVSLAFRNSSNISMATKERIWEAARAAGMTIPDYGDEKIKEGGAHNYALLCSDYVEKSSASPYPNPHVLGLIRDMGTVSVKMGNRLMTIFDPMLDLEKASFDGYFFYGSAQDCHAIKKTTKPILLIDQRATGQNSVAFDQEGSMETLADLLIKKGCRRPFFFHFANIHPKFDKSCRFLGQLLRESGVEMEIVDYNCDGEIGSNEVGRQWEVVRECATMLARRDTLPDALICSNDCFAGMLQLSLRDLGIAAGEMKDPGAIPLIGFDDIPYVPGAGPFTTFRTETRVLAEAALRTMEMLLTEKPSYTQHIRIEPELIIR